MRVPSHLCNFKPIVVAIARVAPIGIDERVEIAGRGKSGEIAD
jgi:hypothetical protein